MWTARAEDADEIGRIWGEAFSEDPVLTWVFAEPDQGAKLRAFFTFLAHEVYVGLGATTVADGACVGWTPPDPPPWPDERGQAFGAMLARTCTPEDQARLLVLNEYTDAKHPTEPHWYLSILGVDLTHRSQGLGTALLARTLEQVDEAGLPAYLESTNPRNITLYERAGFEVVEQVTLPDGPFFTCMWRPAPAAEISGAPRR